MQGRRRKYRLSGEGHGEIGRDASSIDPAVGGAPAAEIRSEPAPTRVTIPAPANETVLNWVRLERYCVLSGDTAPAVHARLNKKIWRLGVHAKKVAGVIWISLSAVEAWLENA